MTVNLGGVETIYLLYPDGARDAETLMIDPLNGDIYVVTKRELLGRVYRAPFPQATGSGNKSTMEYLGQLPWTGATGGDISSDGDEIIIRGYFNASLWARTRSDRLGGPGGCAAERAPGLGAAGRSDRLQC